MHPARRILESIMGRAVLLHRQYQKPSLSRAAWQTGRLRLIRYPQRLAVIPVNANNCNE